MLYRFDKKLRLLMLNEIEKIESTTVLGGEYWNKLQPLGKILDYR